MVIKLEAIRIKNFKSFKDLYLPLNNLNVLIGQNSTGKSNFIEIFSFLKIIFEKSTPYNPTNRWWGYKNLVHNKNEFDPIIIEFYLQSEDFKLIYSITFHLKYGEFKLLEENIIFKDIVTYSRNPSFLRVKYDPAFLEKYKTKLIQTVEKSEMAAVFKPFLKRDIGKLLNGISHPYTPLMDLFPYPLSISRPDLSSSTKGFCTIYAEIEKTLKNKYDFNIIASQTMGPVEKADISLDNIVLMIEFDEFRELHDYILDLIQKSVIIRNINYEMLKTPRLPSYQKALLENGENMLDIMYNWFIEKNGLPEIFHLGIREKFPKTALNFSLLKNGEIYMIIQENGLQIMPPSISEGFLKFLLLLTAIELNPPILLVDELENSMYADLIKYILSEMKLLEETIVVITTHSPVVVDFIDMKDLLLVEKENFTTIKKINKINELKRRLNELGITNSDSWLQGDLYRFDEEFSS